MRPRRHARTWSQFGRADRLAIEAQLADGYTGHCPRCGSPLDARTTTRMAAVLPGNVAGVDLDCRACRLFHPRVAHTAHSIYLLRLHRLAAAVRRTG